MSFLFGIKEGEKYYCRCGDWVEKKRWKDHLKYFHPLEYEKRINDEHYYGVALKEFEAQGMPQDYIICYSHGMKIKNQKCSKGKPEDPCRILGWRSGYEKFAKQIRKRNDHDHAWFKTDKDQIFCYLCNRSPEDCLIYNIERTKIKYFFISEDQKPLDLFQENFKDNTTN
jgi:hypothetical protein